jgi:hypothetical protein
MYLVTKKTTGQRIVFSSLSRAIRESSLIISDRGKFKKDLDDMTERDLGTIKISKVLFDDRV